MKSDILLILKHRPEPVKRSEMLQLLQIGNRTITDRAMRKAIEELIEEGECIESSEKGYQFITNESQVTRAVEYLKAKARSIAIRGNHIIHNWRRRHPDSAIQLDLFPDL